MLAVGVGVALEQAEAHRTLQGAGPLGDDEGHGLLVRKSAQPVHEVGDLLVDLDVEQLGERLHITESCRSVLRRQS